MVAGVAGGGGEEDVVAEMADGDDDDFPPRGNAKMAGSRCPATRGT